MSGCAYQKFAKCTNCKFIVYVNCPNYRKWRAKWLLRALLPITIDKEAKPLAAGKCYFSRSEEVAKQRVAATCLKRQKELVKLNLNQVISSVLDGDEIDADVIYVECKKTTGDNAKIQSVFESFVDKRTVKGCTVMIYAIANTISMSEDWTKITAK